LWEWHAALTAFSTLIVIIDIGYSEWKELASGAFIFIITFLIFDIPLILVHLAPLSSIYTIFIFYSTIMGLGWVVRRVSLLDLLRAFPAQKGRLYITAFWATFSSAMDDIKRILWYCELYDACSSDKTPFRVGSKLAAILGVLLCLLREVPWRIAALDNRTLHLGGL
jgi:hypothetical protein